MHRLIAAAIAGALLVFAASAPAAKRASTSQAKAIVKAVESTSVSDFDQVDAKQYAITDAKVSTKSKYWATANAKAAKGFEKTFQPSYFILVQPAGTKDWVVVDAGSAEVGCGLAPDSVIKDLTGDACPPGQGVK